MLYCNMLPVSRSQTFAKVMSEPTYRHHQHRHPPGERHPAASVAPSILRMSGPARLGVAAVAIMIVWAAVIWAMR